MLYVRNKEDEIFHPKVVDLAERLINNPIEAMYFLDDSFSKDIQTHSINSFLKEALSKQIEKKGIVYGIYEIAAGWLNFQQYELWKDVVNNENPDKLLNYYQDKLVTTLEIDGEIYNI